MDDEYYKRSVFREVLRQQQGFTNKKKLQKSTKSEKSKSELENVQA
jgi:hypothetical protein